MDGAPKDVPDYATVSYFHYIVVVHPTLFVIGTRHPHRSSGCLRANSDYPWPRVCYHPSQFDLRTYDLLRNHGFHFEKAKTAFEEGGGRGELVEQEDGSFTRDGEQRQPVHDSSDEGSRPTSVEKADVDTREKV